MLLNLVFGLNLHQAGWSFRNRRLVLVNEALRFQRIQSQRISTRWKLSTQSPTPRISIGPTNPHDDLELPQHQIQLPCIIQVVCLIQYTVQYKMGLYWRITFTNNKYVLYLFILYCYKLIQSQKYITYYHILSIWWSGMSTRMNNFSCRL